MQLRTKPMSEQVALVTGGGTGIGLYPLPVAGVRGGQGAGALQYLGQDTEAVGGGVQDDEDGGSEVARQPGGERLESLDAAGGSPDDDDVFSGHALLPERAGRNPADD